MNKKIIYGMIAIVVIVAIIVGVWAIFFRGQNSNVNLDLQALKTQIEETGHFNEMAMTDITKELTASMYQIDEQHIEEVVGQMPMMNVQASMYIIVKATPGNVQKVEEKVKAYGQAYEEQWATYLPAQHELVQNRKVGTKGNYVYMVICENSQQVADLIK